MHLIGYDLDDQTQVDSKPAGQPEHASLNQCQLIAANRCSGHPQLVVEITFLCNVQEPWLVLVPTWPRADGKAVYSWYESSISLQGI